MAFKIFIDANVLLDFTLKRANYTIARLLIEKAINGHINAYTTPAIIHITGYWLTKAYGSEKTKELLLSLLEHITTIEADHQTVMSALYLPWPDIEDALQYSTALLHKMDYFISGDKKLIKSGSTLLPILSIADFLEEID